MKDVTTFKVLQRETSVYKYYVELKEDVFTEQGYLNLVIVPDLFITGAGLFLQKLRLKNCLRQKDIANILGVSRESVKQWEHNCNRIPLRSLVKIVETLGLSRDSIYSLIEEGNFSLRCAILPVKFEQIRDIVHYLSPIKDESNKARITLHKCCPDETLSKIKEILNINPVSRHGWQMVYSRELYRYLTTFFRYTKVPKLHPPLTTEVKNWHDDGIDLKHAVFIPCLQSDGDMEYKRKKRFSFSGNNKVLHNLFVDAIYFEYNELPTSYFIRKPGKHFTTYGKKSMNEIVAEVINLAGNSKTSPAKGQSVEEYLQEPQPHLNYLINAPMTEQQIALRIWASAEGCISIEKHIEDIIYPYLAIACAHPVLNLQLKQIAQRHGIHLTIGHDKRSWSGVKQLRNRTLSGCINFLKLGGFIKGVKISANSPYHKGITKDVLTLGILEYIRQRRTTSKWLKKLPIDVHHHNINQIIKNREYKSADYYINYFS